MSEDMVGKPRSAQSVSLLILCSNAGIRKQQSESSLIECVFDGGKPRVNWALRKMMTCDRR